MNQEPLSKEEIKVYRSLIDKTYDAKNGKPYEWKLLNAVLNSLYHRGLVSAPSGDRNYVPTITSAGRDYILRNPKLKQDSPDRIKWKWTKWSIIITAVIAVVSLTLTIVWHYPKEYNEGKNPVVMQEESN